MYYINHEQFRLRLDVIPQLIEACLELERQWKPGSLLLHFAQERTLHLAIETVTDIGSLLIDAFMMRDASSYEDIVEILEGEKVFGQGTAAVLKELVQLRRLLTQDYPLLPREAMHPLIKTLPSVLAEFAEAVPAFISRESL
ncbi:DUF86 domain-containing protein [Paenibacillus filicis]|uniref:DUF86 domain-containing protein n=1 Tax=Paenibacillus gyeongsangnamensis TaxID=3388067 RepID=A0ABT4Q5C8_9BACL|nr:HepT-like ribonuclease domain-containing protein [Paenibacillus filicis]MCZ8512001.1 DUF86 domain-containing protein [Paenibacillus filicis]